MSGETIAIAAEGGAFRAALALPAEGSGPGVLLLHADPGGGRDLARRFAEEGYVVLAPKLPPHDGEAALGDVAAALAALGARGECTGKTGVLGYGAGGGLACLAAARLPVAAAVAYEGFDPDAAAGAACPLVLHLAERDARNPAAGVERVRAALADRADAAVYVYPAVGPGFADPAAAGYDKPAALMAYSRTLALFRAAMGPHYDLGALWEAHTTCEFATRDVAATMATMVAEPYVNHIPTMTGGVGFSDLSRFYAQHFIPKTPADTRLVPVSRTIGADRVVDEMLFCFTHDIEIDWMLPGVAPTGRYVEIPLVAIVRFRGDKLYNEHIYWDQASVLVQIGLLDPAALPIAGAETARKLLDESLPSNTRMRRWTESAAR